MSVPPSRRVLELIVTGPESGQTWRQTLLEGHVVRVGRAPQSGWAVPWDRTISREHFDVCWQQDRLAVVCLPNATNPIKFKGKNYRDIFAVPGEVFQIGLTTFQVHAESVVDVARQTLTLAAPVVPLPQLSEVPAEISDQPEDEIAEEYSYKTHELESVAFGDTERQLEVLSNLPQLISGSHTDVELAVTLVGLLLKAIPPSIAVAVAVFDETDVQEIRRNINSDAPLPNP